MTKAQLKLIPFGIAFLFLLVQNAMLAHYKRGADARIADLEQQVVQMEVGTASVEAP